ncbi:transporter substrate-binding domain-containing protein [Lachnoclostridium sp. Marseille-P6806]|uniref:transporter substrate-binding domain-containing protein n=1 Tax=Lachnoclostridium sp. Marseille-P6806 TaxID=2364793 RepID=UPI001F5F8134|nr:transporter substrate-binding domain-containing protein [Lachnoclostridium sp. Marseille-P6806]
MMRNTKAVRNTIVMNGKAVIFAAFAAAAALALSGCGSAGQENSEAENGRSGNVAAGASGTETSGGAAADHLGRIREQGELVVGLEGDWQPFSYHDEEDQLVGFDVEVAGELAERMGVSVRLVEGPWDGLFAGMDSGRYDIVVNGVDVTEERQKSYDFSEPYAYDRPVLIVAEDNADITSFEDLKGRTTANSIGSTYQELGEQYGAQVSGVDTLVETLQMVMNGQVDATINAATSFGDYMKAVPDAPLRIAAVSETATAYAIPMTKGEDNAALRVEIDRILSEMREDGTLSSLSEKYFGADLTQDN